MANNNLAVNLLINATDRASGVFGTLKNNAGKVAGAIAGYFGISFFKSAVDDAEKLEAQYGTLEAIIKSTGGTAGLTADDIVKMSKRLDEATLGSAEGFRTAAGSLLTFKSVGKDAFETTLTLANDLAQAGFGTLEGNAIQLGKALEDPVKGLSALAESGVSFSESEKELIKSLVETGDKAKAQGLILEALAAQVGGAGSGAGGGLSGAIDLVGKRFTDFKEQLGKGMLKPLTAANTKVAEFIKSINQTGAVTAFGNAIGQAFSAVVEFSASVANGIGAIYTELSDSGTITAFQAIFTSVFTEVKTVISAVFTGITDIYNTLSQSGAYAEFISVLGEAFTVVKGLVTDLLTGITGLYSTLSDSTASLSFGDVLGQVLTRLIQGVTFLVSAFTTGLSTIEAAFHGVVGVAQSFFSSVLSGIATIQEGMAKITFGDLSKRWASDAQDMRKSSEDMAKSMNESFDKAGKAVIKAADNATLTRKAWTAMGEDIKKSNSDAKKSVDDLATSTETTAKKIITANNDVAISEKDKAIASTQANTEIIKGNKASADSVALIDSASKTLKISLAEIKGEATSAGIASSQAFKNIANAAGLSSNEIAKVATQAVSLAKTKGDIDLLTQSFSDVGFEASKQPQLITAIVDKIKSMGGSLEGIPSEWIAIANATKDAKNQVDDYTNSVRKSEAADRQASQARQNQINQENNLRQQEAADNAAADAAKAKAEKEKQDKLNAPQFIAFSSTTQQQLSQLSAANKDEFKRQSDAANIRNQILGWQGIPSNQKTDAEIIKQLYEAQQKKQQRSANKTINVNFKANGKQSSASFSSQQEANRFLDILKTAGSVS